MGAELSLDLPVGHILLAPVSRPWAGSRGVVFQTPLFGSSQRFTSMKSHHHSLTVLLGIVLALATPTFAAEKAEKAGKSEKAAAAAPAAAPAYTDEQKNLLKALDAELARFDALLEKDDDVQHKATVKAFLDAFKDRRDAMNKVPFDQGKYDEIRFDINVEYQRLAMWLAAPITPPPAKKGAAKK
jgi:hypothetical protein